MTRLLRSPIAFCKATNFRRTAPNAELSEAIIETSWFNVSAWAGRDTIADLYTIQKGAWVRVVGRLRVRKYTTQTGEERSAMDVIAGRVELLKKDDEASTMQPQRD